MSFNVDFRMYRSIGSGSMATVWLAYRGRLCGRISRNARSDGLKTLVFCNQQGTVRPPMALSGH